MKIHWMVVVLRVCIFPLTAAIDYMKGASYVTSENVTTDIAAEAFEKVFNIITKNSRLEKSSFNSKNRLIFIAGLEGTGHHAWQTMIKVCMRHHYCTADRSLTEAMMQYDGQVIRGLFGAADTSRSAEHLAYVYDRMKKMAAKSDAATKLNIIGLGVQGSSRSGMMSYPNFDGLFKPLDNPDVYMMAVIAEALGIDFRVVVMHRAASPILASVKRRNFGNEFSPRVLIASAEALYSQLHLLDRKFFHCVQYETMGEMSVDQKKNLLNFLFPPLQKIWNEMLRQIHISNPETHQSTIALDQANTSESDYYRELNIQYQAKYLDAKIKQIEERCAEI